MNLEDVILWLEILTPVFLLLMALYRWDKKLTRRLDAQDATVKNMTDDLNRQFGGNGGGLREAVNTLQAGQTEIRGEVKDFRAELLQGQEGIRDDLKEHVRFHLDHPPQESVQARLRGL